MQKRQQYAKGRQDAFHEVASWVNHVSMQGQKEVNAAQLLEFITAKVCEAEKSEMEAMQGEGMDVDKKA